MSFTLQLWEKPADWPWPGTKAEADEQFERMLDSPPPGQNPKFLDFGKALYQRFPPEMDAWLDGSEEGLTDDATLGFGLRSGSPHWDDAFEHAWEQASRLGLNLYDPQSGVHYLGNGDVPEEPDLEVRFAVRARETGDDATAWAAYRRLAARGNSHAIYAMGRGLRFGVMNQRRHLTLAAALQLVGAHDAQTRLDAKTFLSRLPADWQANMQKLLARMTSGAEPLLQIVDSERQTLNEAFQRIERQMLDPRTRVEASDELDSVAGQGHEIAAYQRALEAVIGWDDPNYESARFWCLRAAEWDHEPAKLLLALMCERGWGGPVDLAEAAKWKDQAQQPQKSDDAPAPGGLSLEPMAQAPTPSSLSSVAQSTGSVMRNLVSWFAREGNPHAAYHMGTLDENGHQSGLVNLAQARAWYAQAAEGGHADATYNLATYVESGSGGPKDVLAAKALYMLAHARGSTGAEGLRISAAEKDTVRALAIALREPGRLRSVLLARAAGAGGDDRGSARPAGSAVTVPPPAVPSRSLPGASTRDSSPSLPTGRTRTPMEEADDPQEPERAAISWHLGHLALAIGAVSGPMLIALAKPGASFRVGMLILALVAAFGAWRAGRDHGWSPVFRAVVALLAAVPLLGMVVCVALIFKAMRERN